MQSKKRWFVLLGLALAFIPFVAQSVTDDRPTVVEQAVGDTRGNLGLAVSASRRLVAAQAGNEIHLFDLSTGFLMRRVPAISPAAVALSDDDRFLAIGGNGLVVVDLLTGETVIALDASVSGLRFSSNGKWLIIIAQSGLLQLPTTLRRNEPGTVVTPANIGPMGGRGLKFNCSGDQLSVSADGQKVVCETYQGNQHGWALVDVATGAIRHTSPRLGIAAITPDGKHVLEVAGSELDVKNKMNHQRAMRLHSVDDPNKTQEGLLLADPSPQNVTSGALHPIAFRGNEEAIVLIGHKLHRISLKPLRATQLNNALVEEWWGYQSRFGMDPEGRLLLAFKAGKDRVSKYDRVGEMSWFHLLDVDALDQPPFRTITGPAQSSWSDARLSPSGLLLAQRFRDRARVTNLTNGAIVYERSGLGAIGLDADVRTLIDPTGKKAFFARNLDRRERSLLRETLNKQKNGTRISDDAFEIEQSKFIERFMVDLSTGRHISLGGIGDHVDALFSPQGSYLLHSADYLRKTELVSTTDGKLLAEWPEMKRKPNHCTFSDDEKRLQCAGKVYSLPDGKLILDAALVVSDQLDNAKISPDGQWLMIRDRTVARTRVLAVSNGKEVLLGPLAHFAVPSWSSDSRLIEFVDRASPNTTIYQFSGADVVTTTKIQVNDCNRPILGMQGTIICLSEVAQGANRSQRTISQLEAVQIHDARTGAMKQRHRWRFPRGFNEDMNYAFSPDQKNLMISTEGGRAILNVQSGEVLATVTVGEDDWVITLPEGYYTAPRGANKLIAMQKGNRAYAFDEFDLSLNRPDVVRERLGAPKNLVAALKRAQAKRVQRIGVVADAARPQAALASRELPQLTKADRVRLPFSARPGQGGKVTRAQVYVNGVPTLGRDGVAVNFDGEGRATQPLSADLVPGANRVQLAVFDEKGNESLRDTSVVTRVAAPAPVTRYVLAIGVSKYQDAALNLDYAAKDAGDLSQSLQRQAPGIDRVVVKTLLDSEVTREKLREARRFFIPAKPQDQAIVFIAGHGLLDGNDDYYFAAHDIDANRPELKGVPIGDIEDLFAETPARRRLLLMDTCHSGEVDRDMAQKLSTLPKGVGGSRGLKSRIGAGNVPDTSSVTAYVTELFADLRRGVGATALASANGIELALESAQLKNGLFTSALLEALSDPTTDTNKSRSVEMSELRDRVVERVKYLSNGTQTPSTRVENYDEDLLLNAWMAVSEKTEKPVARKTKKRP